MPDAIEAQRRRTPRPKEYLAADSRENSIPVLLFEPNARPLRRANRQFSNSPEEDRMRKPFCRLMLVLLAFCLLAAPCLGNGATEILKRQERSTISLELEFAKKNPNALQRVISFLNSGLNGYATGFLVGWRLVISAYHPVCGTIDVS